MGKVRTQYYIYLGKEQMRCTVRKDNLGYNQESHLEICRVGGTGKKICVVVNAVCRRLQVQSEMKTD